MSSNNIKNNNNKNKKKKTQKNIKSNLDQDLKIYLENKKLIENQDDQVILPRSSRSSHKFDNQDDQQYNFYEIIDDDNDNDNDNDIIKNIKNKKDSFTLNNVNKVFDNVKLIKKSNSNLHKLDSNRNQSKNNLKSISSNENLKITKNNKLKIENIKDLNERINDITDYNSIKSSFKLGGQDIINNEINIKYRKKNQENIVICDKLKDTFKKLVLKEIKDQPNVSEIILNKNIDDDKKIKLLKKYMTYLEEDEYLSENTNKIKIEIKNIIDGNDDVIEDDIEILTNRIKHKEMPDYLKKKLLNMSNKLSSSNSNKLQNYIEDILKIPYNKKICEIDRIKQDDDSKKQFIKNIYNKLNEKLFGLDHIKNSILSYFCLKLNNPESTNKKYLCLCGPPGVGKTSIAQYLAEAIDIPHSYISMSNVDESSVLLGHSYTFDGSIYGSLSSSFINNKCRNGIIIFDELDKCSDKVQKNMLGIFDPLQNNKFKDAYFGEFYIDLSETVMIICVNSLENINEYLRNRFHVIHINDYTQKDKKIIANNYLIPKLIKEYNLYNLKINEDVIQYILNHNINEKGVRTINTDLMRIFELAVVDKYMNNANLNDEFTIKDICKLNLTISNDNKYRNIMYC